MPALRKSLTFSNAIALLALFIALGGSVYAASGKISGTQIKSKSLPGDRIKPKTVTATQIQKGAIGAGQLKPGAVSTNQIAAGSITGTQIAAGAIGGAQIQPGSLGSTQIDQSSLTGISAASVHLVQYVASTVPLPPEIESETSTTATCPAGMKVIGGGANVSNPRYGSTYDSAPTGDRSGWSALGYAFEPNVTMTVTAICTPVATTTG